MEQYCKYPDHIGSSSSSFSNSFVLILLLLLLLVSEMFSCAVEFANVEEAMAFLPRRTSSDDDDDHRASIARTTRF